ncbi:hypothetical protein AB1E18_015552 [Capra hircus]
MFKGREKFHVEWNMKIKWMPSNQLIKRLDTHEAEIDGKGDTFRIGQRGQRTAAASRSRVGYTQDPRPRLRGPWALSFAVLGVLLLVKPASAMSVRKDEIPQQSSAPLEGSLQQKLCLPGFYMEEASGGCALCADGIDYTNHSNTLPSCLPCMTCKSGEEEKNRCTPTKDTECQCKLSVEKMHLDSVKNAAPGALMGRSWSRTVPPGATSSVWTRNQEPAAPEGPQRRRWLLVPTDGTQSLKLFFSDFAAIFSL